MPQKPHDGFHAEVFEPKLGDGFALAQESEVELERIAIGSDRMRAGTAQTLEVFAEKGFDKCRKEVV
jgi:hypothetical protein